MTHLLEIQDLHLHIETFRGQAKIIDGVDLYIDRGEKVALVGESGSGKTLTAMTILGNFPPGAKIVKGKILFEGVNLLDSNKRGGQILESRGELAYIPQYPLTSLSHSHKIKEQMIDFIKYAGGKNPPITEIFPNFLRVFGKENRKDNKIIEKAKDALLKVRLPSPERILESYPFELSGGMNQRVLIATALSIRPKLLIADEPTSALDVSVGYVINRLILDYVRRVKCALLYITHELGIARRVSDRIYVMYCGSIVECAEAERIINSPLHPYTQGLLAAVPKLTKTEFKGISGRLPSYINPPSGCRFHPRCQYKMPICKTKKPALKEECTRHWVACHLY